MDMTVQSFRDAVRTLLRGPGFTAAAMITLALGIGANTAVFSVVEGVLIRSLPFPAADRLVDIKYIEEEYRSRVRGGATSPLTAYETWRTADGVFEDLAAAIAEQPVLIGPEGAQRVSAWIVTANLFMMLGAQPVLGRLFRTDEDHPGSAPVVVLSYTFWQSRFGGDPDVLGRSITLDTVNHVIVGVMSPDFRTPVGFRHPDGVHMWQALGPRLGGPEGAEWASSPGFWVVGRLRPDVTPAAAEAAAGGALGTVDVPGKPVDPQRPVAFFVEVTEDYFHTLGIPFRRGRAFLEHQASEVTNVVIDEAAAGAYFPGEDPLGQRVMYFGGSRTATISGVVGNTRQESLHEPPPPHIYELLGRDVAHYITVLVRTTGEPTSIATALRRAIQEVDGTVPIDRIATMQELLNDARATHRFYALLLAVFAGVALALAATSIYGIAAYAVTRRTREIGIRMALGADRSAVLGLIVSRAVALALPGIGLGIGGAFAATGVLRSYPFEIGPRDPYVLGAVALLAFGTALVATYVPARRATKVDPLEPLRGE